MSFIAGSTCAQGVCVRSTSASMSSWRCWQATSETWLCQQATVTKTCVAIPIYATQCADKRHYVKLTSLFLSDESSPPGTCCPVSVYLAYFAFDLAVCGVLSVSQWIWRLMSYPGSLSCDDRRRSWDGSSTPAFPAAERHGRDPSSFFANVIGAAWCLSCDQFPVLGNAAE